MERKSHIALQLLSILFLVSILFVPSCGSKGDPEDGEPVRIREDPPEKPSGLEAFGATGVVQVTWVDNSDTEEGFILERNKDSEGFEQIELLGTDVTSYDDLDVGEDSYYQYRVIAENSYGQSEASNLITVPQAPQTLQLRIDTRNSQVHVTWVDQSDQENSFEIQRRDDNGDWEVLQEELAENTGVYADSNNFSAESSAYRVRACASTGSFRGCSSFLKPVATTDIPPTPTLLEVTYDVRGWFTIRFAYDGPDDVEVTSFSIFRRIDDGIFEKPMSVSPQTPPAGEYEEYDLRMGDYSVGDVVTFRVIAHLDGKGESDYSNELSDTVE